MGVLSSFNNFWSNMGYFLLGLLFWILVTARWVGHLMWCREGVGQVVRCRERGRAANVMEKSIIFPGKGSIRITGGRIKSILM